MKYQCSNCKGSSRRLWRPYQTVLDRVVAGLLCGPCALADQGESGPINAVGKRPTAHGETDQIGWFVPAVPTEHLTDGELPKGASFWGYTSVPEEAAIWWRTEGREGDPTGGESYRRERVASRAAFDTETEALTKATVYTVDATHFEQYSLSDDQTIFH